MRSLTAAVSVVLGILMLTTGAFAQSTGSTAIKPFPLQPAASTGKSVNISVSYQFFLDGTTGNMDEQARLADDGRKHLYRMLARECEVLLETIADECYINRANVSSRVRNLSRGRQDGIQISGSATYRVELKPTKRASTASGDKKDQ